MAWYKTGTVSVTSSGTTVTGSGTAWIANAKPGESFMLQGGTRAYEIVSVNSDTSMTITPAYIGSTASGQSYTIVPVRGFPRQAYDALNGAITTFQTYINGALAGRFGDGSLAEPGISFADDVDTGIHRPQSNRLSLVTGGAQRALLTNASLTLDVNMIGAAVIASLNDPTAGKLLLSGAGGLLGNAIIYGSGDDIDTLSHTHFFRFSSGAALPDGTPYDGFGVGIHIQSSTSVAVQVVWRNSTVFSGNMWVRSKESGVWGKWSQSYDQSSILGTVAMASGEPSGALIESEVTANGGYLRLANGTQICWGRATATHAISGASGSGYISLTEVFPFAAAFSGTPFCTASTNDLESWANARGATSTGIQVRRYAFTSYATLSPCEYIAIGNWT